MLNQVFVYIYRSYGFKWAALITACCLVFSVQLGIQTLPQLLSGELFPSDVRAFCKGLTRSATCGFLVIGKNYVKLNLFFNIRFYFALFSGLKMYPIFESTLTVPGTFFLFSAMMILCLPIVYCILPETKDMGLEMIQSYFTPNKTVFYVDLPKKLEENSNDIIIVSKNINQSELLMQ